MKSNNSVKRSSITPPPRPSPPPPHFFDRVVLIDKLLHPHAPHSPTPPDGYRWQAMLPPGFGAGWVTFLESLGHSGAGQGEGAYQEGGAGGGRGGWGKYDQGFV